MAWGPSCDQAFKPARRNVSCPTVGKPNPLEVAMRMLLDVSIPHEPFNSLVRKGIVGKKLNDVLEALKPEAVYFTERDGKRGCIMVVEMADPSKIPALAEPWFLTFNADVKFHVAMTPDDLKKSGLDAVGKKWA